MSFRKGQWVKGKLDETTAKAIHFAHMVGDYYVGIYNPSSQSRTLINGLPQPPEPESVSIVQEDGTNAVLLIKGQMPGNASIHPSMFTELVPVLDKAELPNRENTDPNFVLTP